MVTKPHRPPAARSRRRPWPSAVACLALLAFAHFAAFASGPGPALPNHGITTETYSVQRVPWSVHVIRIPRDRSELELVTTLGEGSRIGLNPLTRQVRSVPPAVGIPLAAINGDFYKLEGDPFAGDPRGLLIRGGELISAPIDRSCFWLNAAGAPQIGVVASDLSVIWPSGAKTPLGLNEERGGGQAVLYTAAVGDSTHTSGGIEFILEAANPKKWLPLKPGEVLTARIREIRRGGDAPLTPNTLVVSLSRLAAGADSASVGDIFRVSTATRPDLKGARTAIGGGPALVHDSKAQPGPATKSHERHPRSALGWNAKEWLFVQVDGRQPGLSVGMTLQELADFLLTLKCEEAINLDGGGSSEIWLNGRILNSPCYGHERSTASALVVVEKKKDDLP